MSDETMIEETITGEWWWIATIYRDFAARSTSIGPHEMRTPFRQPSGGFRASARSETIGDLGTITITGDMFTTRILITAPAEAHTYWGEILERLRWSAERAASLKQLAASQIFTSILNDYYARKARGERPKLKDLAEAAGVNYNSLRQAKIRYDAERRKNVSD